MKLKKHGTDVYILYFAGYFTKDYKKIIIKFSKNIYKDNFLKV